MSFNFGAQNTQQKPTLGVQPLSFSAGTNVGVVAPQSAPAFGAPAASTPAFGAPAAASFGFGATTTTSAAAPLSFGVAQPGAAAATPAVASTGFGFGGQPQTSTAATPGFSLGQPKVLTTMGERNDMLTGF